MLSGRETLGHLNTTLQSARGELQQLERELQRASDAVAKNRVAQSAALKRLASLRLDALTSGKIRKDLDGVDYQVDKLLRDRETAMDQVQQSVHRKDSQLNDLEGRRENLHDNVDENARVLVEHEAAVQSTLSKDSEFQERLTAARAADAIAVSAADKAILAQSDRRDKGAPYDSNELFSYLWGRGYGTSKYNAGPLSRLLDGWVARLCGYEKARQNYWMLLEIPIRLQAHAERVREAADAELENLQSLERAAAEAGGVVVAAANLANAERVQDEVDQEIAECEEKRHKLRSELGRFAVAEDEYTSQCLQLLSEAMGRKDVAQLMRLAASTLTPEDDAQVEELRRLRRADGQLESELKQHRVLLYAQQRRQQELENVRQKFKQSRYDDLRSSFDKGDLLVMMMRQVLGGALRGGTLWDAIRRQQQYRDVGGAWPDFGSGGAVRHGRRRTASRPTWHWPGNTGGARRGGFRLPSAPRNNSSRGGFRTGGSF